MRQLIYFIRKFRYFLLLLLLEFLALFFTVQHHSYHQSKFVNSANSITGGIYSRVNSITEVFHLKTENRLLVEENIHLKNLFEQKETLVFNDTTTVIDTSYFQKYQYSVAKVINNNYTKRNNFLTIDKGTDLGLTSELGVINSNGIIGVIKNVSPHYATVLSILNSSSKINVSLKNSRHFGTLTWDGKKYNTVQIIDIPRQAIIKVGDTIITGGKSTIFPEGIKIGVVTDFKFEKNLYQQINVLLFNDMSNLGYVQIIKNLQKTEQETLEKLTTGNE